MMDLNKYYEMLSLELASKILVSKGWPVLKLDSSEQEPERNHS